MFRDEMLHEWCFLYLMFNTRNALLDTYSDVSWILGFFPCLFWKHPVGKPPCLLGNLQVTSGDGLWSWFGCKPFNLFFLPSGVAELTHSFLQDSLATILQPSLQIPQKNPTTILEFQKGIIGCVCVFYGFPTSLQEKLPFHHNTHHNSPDSHCGIYGT